VQKLCSSCGHINTVGPRERSCLWCYEALPAGHHRTAGGARIVSRPPLRWPLPEHCTGCGGRVPPRAFDCPKCGTAFLVSGAEGEATPSQGSRVLRIGAWVVVACAVVVLCVTAWQRAESRRRRDARVQGISAESDAAPSTSAQAIGGTVEAAVIGPMSSAPETAEEYGPAAATEALIHTDDGVTEALRPHVDDAEEDLAAWLCAAPQPAPYGWQTPASEDGNARLTDALAESFDLIGLPTYPGAVALRREVREAGRHEAHAVGGYTSLPREDVVAFYRDLLSPGARQTVRAFGSTATVTQLIDELPDGVVVVTVVDYGSSGGPTGVRLARFGVRETPLSSADVATTEQGAVR